MKTLRTSASNAASMFTVKFLFIFTYPAMIPPFDTVSWAPGRRLVGQTPSTPTQFSWLMHIFNPFVIVSLCLCCCFWLTFQQVILIVLSNRGSGPTPGRIRKRHLTEEIMIELSYLGVNLSFNFHMEPNWADQFIERHFHFWVNLSFKPFN